ncbi:unnamed protein product [Macrosiphum euphorbiae]|uniref:Uncharacterized protein n=1 Tax=Macrosiphum euphorbiae TaxID=13131 RepID=A0AAV0Y4E2_9HEMI|nr:unnamed protein product [Macrosiphum euphorbiae]
MQSYCCVYYIIIIKRTQRKAEIRNTYKDKEKKFPQYNIGDQVLIKEHRLSSVEDKETHKLFLIYHGPYTVREVHNNNTVTVNNQGNYHIINFKNVKKYYEDKPEPGESHKNN